ncbi:MAG: hypothetical protein KDA68_09505 [Planctomycetaceae bacterium]|nr:hypothetical protein [Planctomycetaceae bacterium]
MLIVAFVAWQAFRTYERQRMINDWTRRRIQVKTSQNIPAWLWKLSPSAIRSGIRFGLFPNHLTTIESYPLFSNSVDTSSILSKEELRTVFTLGDLECLSLKATPFEDKMFDKLPNLRKLIKLDLSGKMQDIGEHFDALEKCPKLKILGLRKMKITPSGFKTLKTLTTIEMLNLDESEFTDGDFLELTELKSLKAISIRRTSVSKEAYRSFRKARPDVYVRLNDLEIENPGNRYLEYGFLY